MDSAKTEQRKKPAQTWFEALRDRLVMALEGVEDALPAGAPLSDRPAGRFKRTAWQRTDHTGAQPISGLPEIANVNAEPAGAGPGGGGVMAMMKVACLKKSASTFRRCSANSPRNSAGNSRRRRRSTFLRQRRFADRASAQSACAGGAYEHALCRHDEILVRRRRRPHPCARAPAQPGRSGHNRFSRRDESRLRRAFSRRALRQVQKVVRRVFLSQTPRRNARHRRHFLRLARQRRFRLPILPSRKRSAAPSSTFIPNWCAGISPSHGAKPSARSSSCGAAAMSNSTCSTTAARFSDCAPAAMSNRSCRRCRRWRNGRERIRRIMARRA